MKLMDKYILREISRPLLFSFFIFSSLWIVNLLIRVLNLAISKGIEFHALFKLILYSLPTVVVTSIPMAALMGTMLGLSRLNNDSEIIALRAAGVSNIRLLSPLIGLGLLLSLLAFFLNEEVVPMGKFLSQEVYSNEITLKKPFPKLARNLFFDGGQQFKLYVRDYSQKDDTMRKVTLYQFTDSFPQVTQAKSAKIEDGNLWVFRDGKTTYFNKDGSIKYQVSFATWSYPISDRYASKIHRKRENKNPNEMNMRELGKEIKIRKSKNLGTLDYETQFFFRSAFPFAALFLIFAGAPVAIRNARGSRSSGFGMGIFLMILYYVLLSSGKSLGGNGTLPPLASNWMANSFLVVAGIYLLRKLRH